MKNNGENRDILGTREKAVVLYEKIKKYKTECSEKNQPNMYAIYGGWGTGKTILLENLKLEIESKDKAVDVIFFRPWEYAKEEENIDEKLLAVLLPNNKLIYVFQIASLFYIIAVILLLSLYPESWRERNFWIFFSIAFLLLLWIFISYKYYFDGLKFSLGGIAIDTTALDIIKKIKGQNPETQKIATLLNNRVSKDTYIFVDDLDRCSAKTVINTLEHIKHFYATGNIFFICAIDQASLARYVSEVYQYAGSDTERVKGGYAYIDKFFPEYYVLSYKDSIRNFIRNIFTEHIIEIRSYLPYYPSIPDYGISQEEKQALEELREENAEKMKQNLGSIFITETDLEIFYQMIEFGAWFNLRKIRSAIEKFIDVYKDKLKGHRLISFSSRIISFDQIFRWCIMREFYPEILQRPDWREVWRTEAGGEFISKFLGNHKEKSFKCLEYHTQDGNPSLFTTGGNFQDYPGNYFLNSFNDDNTIWQVDRLLTDNESIKIKESITKFQIEKLFKTIEEENQENQENQNNNRLLRAIIFFTNICGRQVNLTDTISIGSDPDTLLIGLDPSIWRNDNTINYNQWDKLKKNVSK